MCVASGFPGATNAARGTRAPPRTGAPPREYSCPILPASNPLNRDISHAPVDPNSAQYIASIGASGHLHADFGTNPGYGIPYTVVPPRQPRVPIKFSEYGEESNPGPYPVPPNAPVEGAGEEGDRHVLVLQRGSCKLYELYAARRSGAGWEAGSGAVFDLRSNALRPEGWTSADAAGLPIFPLLVRYPEVRAGKIDHALRVTVQRTQRGYIHPATHFASNSSDTSLPPMGLRLRLKASFRHERLPRRGARGSAGAEALRADRGGQRVVLVHHRSARPTLERRRPEPAQERARRSLPGGAHRADPAPRLGVLLGLDRRGCGGACARARPAATGCAGSAAGWRRRAGCATGAAGWATGCAACAAAASTGACCWGAVSCGGDAAGC